MDLGFSHQAKLEKLKPTFIVVSTWHQESVLNFSKIYHEWQLWAKTKSAQIAASLSWPDFSFKHVMRQKNDADRTQTDVSATLRKRLLTCFWYCVQKTSHLLKTFRYLAVFSTVARQNNLRQIIYLNLMNQVGTQWKSVASFILSWVGWFKSFKMRAFTFFRPWRSSSSLALFSAKYKSWNLIFLDDFVRLERCLPRELLTILFSWSILSNFDAENK